MVWPVEEADSEFFSVCYGLLYYYPAFVFRSVPVSSFVCVDLDVFFSEQSFDIALECLVEPLWDHHGLYPLAWSGVNHKVGEHGATCDCKHEV